MIYSNELGEKKEKFVQKWHQEPRASNRYAIVSALFWKSTFVDIPNDVVDTMKRMDPQEVANILLSKEM